MIKLANKIILQNSKKYAFQFIDGLNEAVTPFHAVNYCKSQLADNGFEEISEK